MVRAQLPVQIETLIVRFRREHPSWGALEIREKLRRLHSDVRRRRYPLTISDFNRRQRLRATYSENIPSVRFLSSDENPARSSEAMIAPGGTQASIVSQ